MPTYHYKCSGQRVHKFELVQKISELDKPVACIRCGEPAHRIIVSAKTVVYKGDWSIREKRGF